MDTSELKENLKRVIELRDELQALSKSNRRGYTLWEYIELFRERLIFVDHGEADKFWLPLHRATTKLDFFVEAGKTKFNSAFATNKTALLAVLDRYIKDLTSEFQVVDQE
jgi:hypothetical protein